MYGLLYLAAVWADKQEHRQRIVDIAPSLVRQLIIRVSLTKSGRKRHALWRSPGSARTLRSTKVRGQLMSQLARGLPQHVGLLLADQLVVIRHSVHYSPQFGLQPKVRLPGSLGQEHASGLFTEVPVMKLPPELVQICSSRRFYNEPLSWETSH